MHQNLKGSCLSVSVGDVNENGKTDVTIVVKAGPLELPPITVDLDAAAVVDQAGKFLAGLFGSIFGRR